MQDSQTPKNTYNLRKRTKTQYIQIPIQAMRKMIMIVTIYLIFLMKRKTKNFIYATGKDLLVKFFLQITTIIVIKN